MTENQQKLNGARQKVHHWVALQIDKAHEIDRQRKIEVEKEERQEDCVVFFCTHPEILSYYLWWWFIRVVWQEQQAEDRLSCKPFFNFYGFNHQKRGHIKRAIKYNKIKQLSLIYRALPIQRFQHFQTPISWPIRVPMHKSRETCMSKYFYFFVDKRMIKP